jgi:hypothetical protein
MVEGKDRSWYEREAWRFDRRSRRRLPNQNAAKTTSSISMVRIAA